MHTFRTMPIALTGLFLALLPLQFLFAGYGVFSGAYNTHELFGGIVLHGLTLLMAIAFAVARRWSLAALSFALVIAIFVQIGLAAIARDSSQPWLGALHPFMAFCYWPYVYFLIWRPAHVEVATRAHGVNRHRMHRPTARRTQARSRRSGRVR